MAKKRIPTKAQARLLARMFGGDLTAKEFGADSTLRACIERGWLTATGETGHYPRGTQWTAYKINASGRAALETFLFYERAKVIS